MAELVFVVTAEVIAVFSLFGEVSDDVAMSGL